MNKIVIATLLVGCCFAMPQGQSGNPVGNPYVRILELESYQNGADFGHALQQEDGTATGQKVGPDGLVYGFYSYVQEGGNRVKVYYRAGKGVGYEVLKVEGLNEKELGNLKATIPKDAVPYVEPEPRPQQPRQQQPAQSLQQILPAPSLEPVQVLPVQLPQLIPEEITPAPHRFDYPASLNLQRTGSGFRSSFKAL